MSPPADYAPSPNTSSLALTRANQLRIQSLLRRLLLTSADQTGRSANESEHIDTLRVLRKTLRELDYNLSWLTQVDLLETLEHILVTHDETGTEISADHFRDELQQGKQKGEGDTKNGSGGNDDGDADDGQCVGSTTRHRAPQAASSSSWRLIHDTTQLLLEALPLLRHEIGPELIESIVPIAVENLGHQRSEVRRASLLLLNMLMRQMSAHFQTILRLFIDYGPANYRNQQARRGAILSLPLLMSQPIVERENLLPLVRCLSGLLVDDSNKNEHLFYSLYLALQRLHMMMGDAKFVSLMGQCEPEAMQLYRQAASRHNSLAGSTSDGASFERQNLPRAPPGARSPVCSSSASSSAPPSPQQRGRRLSSMQARQQQQVPATPVDGGAQQTAATRSQQHVTFENDSRKSSRGQEGAEQEAGALPEDVKDRPLPATNGTGSGSLRRSQSDDSLSQSDSSSSASTIGKRPSGRSTNGCSGGGDASQSMTQREFSSDVSSTCSSDAHLVNPAHYMTKAALQGNPLDNYEQIHHIDHSQVDSLAINDFGPICNTPTMEVAPKLNYLTTIRFNNGRALPPTSGSGGGVGQQQSQGSGALILQDDSLSKSELKFGILPRQLINISLNACLHSADRYEAMQELMCIVRESPVNHLAILMTYFDTFLEQFIAKLIVNSGTSGGGGGNTANASRCLQANSGANMVQQQTSLKLSLIAIDMLETIVIKTKVSTMQYIRPIVGLLLKALGSQQSCATNTITNTTTTTTATTTTTTTSAPLSPAASLMRENTCRVIHKMMAYLPPQHVIDAIFEHKHSRSPLVREESINRVTAACLEYDRNEFNLTKLCYHVLPMLADHEPSVRMAALECIATLAHMLGPGRIGSLLTAAEAVQTNCDYDGLLSAINARLQRHALPRCHSNGLVKYVIKPFLFGASQLLAQAETSAGPAATGATTGGDDQRQQKQLAVAADIRWVLEAPSSHQHSSGPYYHPHSHSHLHASHLQAGQAPVSPLDIVTGHINYLTGTGADSNQGPEVRHQHHRLGVYSPPSMAERRRRSSVVGGLIGHQHHLAEAAGADRQRPHEHHHAMHQMLATGQQQLDDAAGDADVTNQPQQQYSLTRAQRKSSRAEAAGGAGSVGSRRKSSGQRPSRQSISVAQSQPDEATDAEPDDSRANPIASTSGSGQQRRPSCGRKLAGGDQPSVGGQVAEPSAKSTSNTSELDENNNSNSNSNSSGAGSECCCPTYDSAVAAAEGAASGAERVKAHSLPQQQSQQGPKANLTRQQRLSCDHCAQPADGDKAKCRADPGCPGGEGGPIVGRQDRRQYSSRSSRRKSSNINNSIDTHLI